MTNNLDLPNIEHGNQVWRPISKKQVLLSAVGSITMILWLILPGIVMGALVHPWYFLWAAIGGVIYLWYVALLPRRVRATEYMLREDDLLFRHGIMFRRIIAVPYGRMQVVDITGGPLERKMGISKLRMSTASLTADVKIPGLTIEEAESLRDHLVHVAETRRAGL